MNDFHLPPELHSLEDELRRLTPQPPAELRSRVLTGVRRELRRPGPTRRLPLAALVAAVLILGLNLSWVATGLTALPTSHSHPVAVDELAQRIRQVVPELDAAEARRQSLLLSSGSRLVLSRSLSSIAIPSRSFSASDAL